jgi:hypothetical protein
MFPPHVTFYACWWHDMPTHSTFVHSLTLPARQHAPASAGTHSHSSQFAAPPPPWTTLPGQQLLSQQTNEDASCLGPRPDVHFPIFPSVPDLHQIKSVPQLAVP